MTAKQEASLFPPVRGYIRSSFVIAAAPFLPCTLISTPGDSPDPDPDPALFDPTVECIFDSTLLVNCPSPIPSAELTPLPSWSPSRGGNTWGGASIWQIVSEERVTWRGVEVEDMSVMHIERQMMMQVCLCVLQMVVYWLACLQPVGSL